MKYIGHKLKVGGEEGLLLSIIALALEDAMGTHGKDKTLDGRRYFMSRTYLDHLSWLGLPDNWLPSVKREQE